MSILFEFDPPSEVALLSKWFFHSWHKQLTGQWGVRLLGIVVRLWL